MRFNTLDGLRGTAAILVMFYHLHAQAPIAVQSGYLAVDLFLALSGFVISRAYEDRLRAGLSLREFAVLRLVRVYPMAFLGAAIGVLFSGRYLPSLLLIPDIGGPGALYPANVPLWSLAFELVINLGFALLALRLGWRGLGAVIAASAAILAYATTRNVLSDLGVFWSTAGFGFARMTFSFAVGVAMHRLHGRFVVARRTTHLAWLPPIALALILILMPANDPFWGLASIFVLLPAVLWLGTIWEAPSGRLFDELAALSYPLYCIHGVIIQAFRGFAGPPSYLWILLLVAAWWLNSRVDAPLRTWLLSSRAKHRALPEPA